MKKSPKNIVDDWNDENEIGTDVRFWSGQRKGDGALGKTTSAAFILGGHTPCVMIDTGHGAIALTHVEPHVVYCHECSKAGGADRAIHHAPPACPSEELRP